MATLEGPFALSANFQLRLPVAIARAMRLGAGDRVYWRASDDNPDVLELIPAEVVERRYSAGERLERTGHPRAHELTEPAAHLSEPR